jgi:hypothetical protein
MHQNSEVSGKAAIRSPNEIDPEYLPIFSIFAKFQLLMAVSLNSPTPALNLPR